MDLVSPRPFWPLKNGLLGIYPPLRQNIHCDVIILGAGISGALIAETLSESGLNTVVIDKRDVLSGSTSASTALLQYEIDVSLVEMTKRYGKDKAEQAYRACYHSIDRIADLVRKLDVQCAFQRKPSVYMAASKGDIRSLQEECSARCAAGIPVEFWDEKEIAARFSFSRPGALISAQGAELDCHYFSGELLKTAVKNGVRIFDRTCVDKIESGTQGVRLETDKGYTIHATHAIFATGYESQEYLPKRVVNLKSTYAAASEPLESFTGWWEQCLIWETRHPYLYLRTTDDGRAMIGGEDDTFHNPAQRDKRVENKAEKLARQFHNLFPSIEFETAYSWAGTFGETKDGLAYIGAIRQMPNCLFALGFGGNGIVYSQIASEIIKDALFGKIHPNAPLFSFDR